MKRVLKYLLIIFILWIIIAIFTFFLNLYFALDNNNLNSDDFYIDRYSSNTCLSLTRDSTFGDKYDMYLCGVITANYNDEYILIVRKDSEHFNCKQGIPKLIKKRLQYMIIKKGSKDILVTNNQKKFNLKLQKLNIDLKLKKTDEELNELIKNIRPKNLTRYDDCSPVSNFPFIEY